MRGACVGVALLSFIQLGDGDVESNYISWGPSEQSLCDPILSLLS